MDMFDVMLSFLLLVDCLCLKNLTELDKSLELLNLSEVILDLPLKICNSLINVLVFIKALGLFGKIVSPFFLQDRNHRTDFLDHCLKVTILRSADLHSKGDKSDAVRLLCESFDCIVSLHHRCLSIILKERGA